MAFDLAQGAENCSWQLSAHVFDATTATTTHSREARPAAATAMLGRSAGTATGAAPRSAAAAGWQLALPVPVALAVGRLADLSTL